MYACVCACVCVSLCTFERQLVLLLFASQSSLAQPQMMVVSEIDGKMTLWCLVNKYQMLILLDVFLPTPNSLLVNLRQSKEVHN